MITPKFSICIPNYNHGRFIGDTIQSVLQQTYQNFEIVIADNASTDNSIEIVKKFSDPRIRLYTNQYNIGFAPNLQRVTSYAKYDFVNLLSSDDQMKPNALEAYADIISRIGDDSKRLVLFSEVENFDINNKVHSISCKALNGFYTCHVSISEYQTSDLTYQRFQGLDVLRDSLMRLRAFAPFLSIVYSRSLWEKVEGYNSIRTIGPDKHFGYKLLGENPIVIYVPRPLFRYRLHDSDNRATQTSTLKQPIDDYLYTLEYSEKDLIPLGLSLEILKRNFVEFICLEEGLSQFFHGNYGHSFRLLMFGFASYPKLALRLRKTYLLLSLLLCMPISKILIRPSKRFSKRQRFK